MIDKPLRQKDLRAAVTSCPAAPPLGTGQLAARLTGRDRWLLRMLYEHRVLTSHQIIALAFGAPRLGRRRLLELVRYGVIARFTPYRTSGAHPAHYVLAPAGAAVLAAEEGIDVAALRWRYDRAIGVAAGIQLAHSVGVGDWFTSLVAHARHHDDASALSVWWSQTRCQRLWGDLVVPDGYGCWSAGGSRIEFFVEFDLASENLSQVARKLAGYAKLAESTAITTPVLFWLPTIRRETAARIRLYETWKTLADPAAVPVATAAADLADPAAPYRSPADRLWLPLDPSTGNGRVRLHQLPTCWPQLKAAAPAPAGDAGPAASRTILPAPAPTPPQATTAGGG